MSMRIRKIGSALLAFVLAFAMCVPAVSLAYADPSGPSAGGYTKVTKEIKVYGLPGVADGTSYSQDIYEWSSEGYEVTEVPEGGLECSDVSLLTTVPDNYYEQFRYVSAVSDFELYRYAEKPADFDGMKGRKYYINTGSIVKAGTDASDNSDYIGYFSATVPTSVFYDRLGAPVANGMTERAPLESLDSSLILNIPGYEYADEFSGFSTYMSGQGDSLAGFYNSVTLYYNAVADDTSLPTVELHSSEGVMKGTEYTAIKVFDADSERVSADKFVYSNFEFTDAMKGVDLKALLAASSNANDDFADVDISIAQNAAEFVAHNITDKSELVSNEFGMKLARELVKNGAKGTSIIADDEVNIETVMHDGTGYYLFVRTSELTGENTAATSPVFIPLHESSNQVYLKSAIPTVTKQIKEDSTGEWGVTADSSIGQDVDYRITGTVAQNVAAYDNYAYKFMDTIEAGKLLIDVDSIALTVDGKDVKSQATITYENDVLDVEFANLLALDDPDNADSKIAITPDTEVVLTYTAKLTATSDIAGDGNENGVTLFYENNPVIKGSMGRTKESKVRDFTYVLNLNKVDHKTGAAMQGVEFSFKNTAGKWLNADGTESDTEVYIPTDENGAIKISRVDADTYTVSEKTPDKYRPLADFTVTVSPIYGEDELAPELQKVTALDGNFNAEVDVTYVNNLTKDADAGLVDWTVRNVKYVDLPITGEEGIFLLTLLGITLVAGGVTISVLRRKEQF